MSVLVAAPIAAFAATLLMAADPATTTPRTESPEYRLIDMVVAEVDSTVITFSELVAETRLVLIRTGGPELARAGSLSQSLLSAVLRSIVVRELILGEVRRLKLRDVPEPEVKKAIEHVRSQFVSPSDYQRFLEKSGFLEPGAEMLRALDAPPSLVAVVTQELLVERFLDVRVRRNVAVRESEVVLCYEANKERIGRPYAEVKNQVRLRFEEQRADRALEALVDQLERRATVRYSPSFEPPPKVDDGAAAIGIECPETAQKVKGETEP
jgi:hypothetical protein